MRRLTLATVTLITLAAPLGAQGVSVPTLTFPQPGVFCGPLKLCGPLVTQSTGT